MLTSVFKFVYITFFLVSIIKWNKKREKKSEVDSEGKAWKKKDYGMQNIQQVWKFSIKFRIKCLFFTILYINIFMHIMIWLKIMENILKITRH